jgi:DNA-binding IscR family transcriptional regulator
MRSLRRWIRQQCPRSSRWVQLARTPDHINIGEVLAWLGGRLFEPSFCSLRRDGKALTHTVDCSIRSLWQSVQHVVDQMLGKTPVTCLAVSDSGTPGPAIRPSC